MQEPVWVMQEYMKGTSLIHGANLLPPFPHIVYEGGWGRNAHYPLWCATGSMLGLSDLAREDVIKHPLFTPFRNESERMNSTNRFSVAVGGYSGRAVKPIALRFIAELSGDARFKGLHLSGMGGIETWRDALDFIAYGCGSVQVTTAVMAYGRCHLSCRDGGRQAISIGRDGKPVLDPKRCVGCHLCVLVCPAFAIVSSNIRAKGGTR